MKGKNMQPASQGFMMWVVGGLLSVLGILLLMERKAILAAIKAKASAETVASLKEVLEKKADTDRMADVVRSIDLIAANSRSDFTRIFDEIKMVTRTHSEFAQDVQKALGERPTREECQQRWTQAAKQI